MELLINKLEQQLPRQSWKEFAYFSANWEHILGVPFGQGHIQGYKQLKEYTAKQACLDLRNGFRPKTQHPKFLGAIHGNPAMMISFHFGSYRTLPLRVLSQGRSVCVLLSQDVYDLYAEYYENLLESGTQGNPGAKLFLLKVEDPALFFKIRKMKALGAHIFVYADGSRGAVCSEQEERLPEVSLLQANMHVRSGFLGMAHLLGMDSYLLLDHTPDPLEDSKGKSDLFCYKVSGRSDRREFVAAGLAEIYARFGKALKKNPFMWEAFLYLHCHSRPESSVFNWKRSSRMLPFYYRKSFWGLDRFTYRTYQLSRDFKS